MFVTPWRMTQARMENQEAGNPQQLPPSFRQFCADNDISEEIYRSSHALPRYIRFRTPQSADVIAAVSEQLGVQPQPVRWLPGFFTLPQEVKIAGSDAYKNGQIFGIDASSGAAVSALGVQPGDRVLDLCAAPGAKLCLIAEQVAPNGSATGVDVSRPRLAATRTLLRKYGAAHNCRLFLADGTTFDAKPPTCHKPGSGGQKPVSGFGFGSKEVRESRTVGGSGRVCGTNGVCERSNGISDCNGDVERNASDQTDPTQSEEAVRKEVKGRNGVCECNGISDCNGDLEKNASDQTDPTQSEEAVKKEVKRRNGVWECNGISKSNEASGSVEPQRSAALAESQQLAVGCDVTHAKPLTSPNTHKENFGDGADRLENESTVGDTLHAIREGLDRTDLAEGLEVGLDDNNGLRGAVRSEDESTVSDVDTLHNLRDELGPTDLAEGLDRGLDGKDGLRGGSHPRGGRRRRERREGDGSGPQLFFFGRGISPPELETGEISADRNLYDKVLVDAECTHDGSLKHIQKYDWWGWDSFERRVMDPQRLAALTDLQGRLLRNGFRLLKPGGTLVYSTCSFTKAQNEGVVSAFLDAHPDADLVVITQATIWPCSPGGLPHTLRFTPDVSKTGGLFIAKMIKRPG